MGREFDDDHMRVGTPERERAIGLINDAFSDGYLDVVEFEERSDVIYRSKTRKDLRAAVVDLPNGALLFPAAPRQAVPVAPSPATAVEPVGTQIETVHADWESVRRRGHWVVPPVQVWTGEMGTFDFDYRSAEFSVPVVTVQVEATASSLKVRLGPDQELRHDRLDVSRWLSLKDKAGQPLRPGGHVIVFSGALTGASSLVVKRG